MMDNFDTGKFILEIHNRPPIWDNSNQDYTNKDVKRQCWREVADMFVKEDLSETEKNIFGIELQKRWKNLRSCYTRELKRQKTATPTSGLTQRKSEYVYFRQLHFLKNVVTHKDLGEVEEDNSDNDVIERPKKAIKRERQMSEDYDPLEVPISSVEQRQIETPEFDEDKLFLLSLLSTLKGLPRNVKMATKIKILTVLDEASDYYS